MVEVTAWFLFDCKDLKDGWNLLGLQEIQDFKDFSGFQKGWETVSVKVSQNDQVLAQGKGLDKFQVKHLDLLEECVVEINDGEETSQVETSLIPLLTNPQLVLLFCKDLNLNKFFANGIKSSQDKRKIQEILEKKTGFEFFMAFTRNELPDVQLIKENLSIKYSKEDSLGISINSPNFLQDFRLALNSKLIQEEAKLINFEQKPMIPTSNTQENEKIRLLMKSLEECNKLIQSQSLIIENMQAHAKDLQSQISTQSNQLSLKSSEIFSLHQQIDSLQASLQAQEGLSIIHESLLKSNKSLKDEIKVLEEERQNLRKKFQMLFDDFESLNKNFQSCSSEINENVKNDSECIGFEVDSLKNIIANQQTEILRLECEIESLKNDANFAKTAESFNLFQTWAQSTEDPSSLSFSQSNPDNPSSQNLLQGINKIPSQASQLKSLHEKLKETQQKLEEAEETLQHQEGIIRLISANSKVASTHQKLDQIPNFQEDLLKTSQDLKKIWEVSCEFERNFYSKSSSFFKKINKLSEMNLKLHRLVEKFVKIIYDKDCHIYMLRNIARDAALERKVYVPVKTDPIDICLSEYINNRKSPLQIPLLREDSGVYNFYTRTIKLKIENNKVIVRLGGGFEGIDEFLNSNTQTELDKLEERRKFFCPESVKKFIDFDFQILGLPSVIDFFTPVTPLPESSGQVSGPAQPSSPKSKKRPSIIFKESSAKVLMKKRTMG